MSLVVVGVAVQAAQVRDGLFEVAGAVAPVAGHAGMLPEQRERGTGVIEVRRQLDPPPGIVGMALPARCLKRAAMRIRVTRNTVGKCQSLELEVLSSLSGLQVALAARDLLVRTGELKPRGTVLESGSRFPL